MNIYRKNRTILLFASFVITLFLVGSAISVTAHDLTVSSPTCPTGLVSWWTGDEISGKTVLDIRGKNNGTMVGGITVVPGKVGNAFKFDGKSGYITMGNPDSLNFGTEPFSLEFWFFWDGGPNVNSVLRKASHPIGGRGAGYWVRIGGTHLEFFLGETIGPDGNPKGHASTPFSPNTWHHVVATSYPPSNQSIYSGNMSLYIDGIDRTGRRVPNPVTDSNASFTLGARNDESGISEFFAGLIDEVSVYNRALDSSEVRAIFNAGGVGKCHKPTPTPEPPKSPTPTPSKSPVSPSPTPNRLNAIIYPVKELGNCASQQECKTYCSVSTNYSQCATFAQKNGLEVEIPDNKKGVFSAMQKGESPGQCKDEVSCRNYCGDTDNIEECADFADKFDLVTPDELKEMRQIANAKKAGVSFPGNCKTKESCLKYCDNSANAVVCMEFAQKAGFIPKEDVEAISKILPYLKNGGKLPGGCTTKKSCDTYCENDANTIECVDFAAGVGFITKEEADMVKRVGGKGPGNCKSREACDSYCKDAAHIDECVDFAVKAGFISKEDADQAKKYKITSGPGGCKSKAECETFCVFPENQETCFNFAKDHGMLSEEDLKNIGEQKKFLESLNEAPPKWLSCMEKELGPDFFGRFKAGKLTQSEAKSQAIETTQRKCESLMEADIRKEIEVCLSRSCSEFDACIKSVQRSGGKQDGQQQGQGAEDLNPKIEAKIQTCQKEKINACLAKSCNEFQACINSLGGGGGEQKQETPDPAVQAKFMTCQPKKGSGGENSQPSSGGKQQPTQEEIQKQIEEQQKQTEEQIRKQYEDQNKQQYPLLLQNSLFAAILNFLLGARK